MNIILYVYFYEMIVLKIWQTTEAECNLPWMASNYSRLKVFYNTAFLDYRVLTVMQQINGNTEFYEFYNIGVLSFASNTAVPVYYRVLTVNRSFITQTWDFTINLQ